MNLFLPKDKKLNPLIGNAGVSAVPMSARISNNLGDAKSLITHPTTTTHSKFPAEERIALGISDGLLRLSIGLEHIDDIIADLDRRFLI